MGSWPLQNRSLGCGNSCWYILFVEPESGSCFCAPTRTSAPTLPPYCSRQLSLMGCRVSETQQLLQMALLFHLAVPHSASTGGGKHASDPHLCRTRENDPLWNSAPSDLSIFPKLSSLKAWGWWDSTKNAYKLNLFGIILICKVW